MRQVKALLPVRAREFRFVLGIRVTVRRLEQVGQKRSISAVDLVPGQCSGDRGRGCLVKSWWSGKIYL